MIKERWRPIAGWPYEVSDLGRVRRTRGGCGTRAGFIQQPKTRYVTLRDKGRHTRIQTARLVLLAFQGPARQKTWTWALHIDDDVTNNKLTNLYWGTPHDNARDCLRNGKGSPRWKATPELVRTLLADYRRGVVGHGYVALSRRHGVSWQIVRGICSGKTWTHVAMVGT